MPHRVDSYTTTDSPHHNMQHEHPIFARTYSPTYSDFSGTHTTSSVSSHDNSPAYPPIPLPLASARDQPYPYDSFLSQSHPRYSSDDHRSEYIDVRDRNDNSSYHSSTNNWDTHPSPWGVYNNNSGHSYPAPPAHHHAHSTYESQGLGIRFQGSPTSPFMNVSQHIPHQNSQPYQIIYTSDSATKLSDRVRRRCFNCSTTDTSTWRRSNLSPGKVLCNKCGLFERTHQRSRPDQFPHRRILPTPRNMPLDDSNQQQRSPLSSGARQILVGMEGRQVRPHADSRSSSYNHQVSPYARHDYISTHPTYNGHPQNPDSHPPMSRAEAQPSTPALSDSTTLSRGGESPSMITSHLADDLKPGLEMPTRLLSSPRPQTAYENGSVSPVSLPRLAAMDRNDL